jgi:uncharacterized protein (DUF2249 family)
MLARGEEPFGAIMAAANRVRPGEALRVLASFEPIPLYRVLGRRGFGHATTQISADTWEVIFSRTVEGAAPEPSGTPPEKLGADVDIVHLDVSDLAPPEPMVRILEAAAQLGAEQTLQVEHHRRPVYLYPQLDAQGFVHETVEIGPGHVQIRIRRGVAV